MYAIIRSENVIGVLIYSYSMNMHLVYIDEHDLLLIRIAGSLIKLYSTPEFRLEMSKYKSKNHPEHYIVRKAVIRYGVMNRIKERENDICTQ